MEKQALIIDPLIYGTVGSALGGHLLNRGYDAFRFYRIEDFFRYQTPRKFKFFRIGEPKPNPYISFCICRFFDYEPYQPRALPRQGDLTPPEFEEEINRRGDLIKELRDLIPNSVLSVIDTIMGPDIEPPNRHLVKNTQERFFRASGYQRRIQEVLDPGTTFFNLMEPGATEKIIASLPS